MADFKINHDIKTILIKELLNETEFSILVEEGEEIIVAEEERYLYLVFSKDSAQGSVSQTADVTSFVGGTKTLVYVVKVDTENDVYIGVPTDTEGSLGISGDDKVDTEGKLLEGTNYDYIKKSNLNKYLVNKFDLLTVIKGISADAQKEYNIISLVKCASLGNDVYGNNDVYDYTDSTPDNTLFNGKTVQIIGQYRTPSEAPLPLKPPEPTPPNEPTEIDEIKIDIRL